MGPEMERAWVRAGTGPAVLGVLLAGVCVVLSLLLPPGAQPEVRLGLAVGVSLCPMPLLIAWLFRPPARPSWPPLALQLSGCAALAVGSFWLWRRAEQPVLAFALGAVYTVLALLRVAAQIAISRLPAAGGATGSSGGRPGLGARAEPAGRSEPASESP